MNPHDQDQAESGMTTQFPASSDLHNLGSQAYLIELFPMAAYAVRAPNGVIAWFNSRAAELWGRVPAVDDTDERFCGAYKLYHADGTRMAHCDTPVALALETGTPVHWQEVVIERPDGSRVFVSVHIDPIRDKDGVIVGAVNFFHDISEQKQAERVRALLAAIVDSTDDAIVSKNLDGVITSWNRGAKLLFGYSAEEAIGQNITLIVPPDRRREEEKILEQLKRGERIDHFETVRVRKDGTTLDISLTISPVKDAAGRVVGASKIARDITASKEAEKALKNVKNELEAQVLERTRDLQNQIQETQRAEGNLRALTGRLLQVQDDERRRMARELHDSVGQLLAAINMNISKVVREKEKLSSVAEKCVEENATLMQKVSQEIRTVSYLLHPPLLDEVGLRSAVKWYIEGFVERSKINVNLDMSADFDRLSSDQEIALFRVVQECLTNIHRHSGSSKAAIHIARNDGRVQLEVKDEGSGIALDKQLALNSSGALGVGVRGMRERLRQLGGNLEIQSNGKGTIVIATLPVDHPKATTPSG
jgi:PAS domain S-box-containing protein